MHTQLLLIAIMVILLIFKAEPLRATDHISYIPIDTFECKYREGKSSGEFDEFITKWNAFMDENNPHNYAAWTMTKHYANAEQDFDIVWIGVHKDAITMGEGTDKWLEIGGEIAAEFGEILECNASANYASRVYKSPPKDSKPADAVLEFSNCKLNEGVSYDEVAEATIKWAKLRGEAGSVASMYHWFPIYGNAENDINFKSLVSYPSHIEFGKDYERMGTGGLIVKKHELLGELMRCDVSRLYNAKLRRFSKFTE